jgi:hypothetical protein
MTCNNITSSSLTSTTPTLLSIQIITTMGVNCIGNWYLKSANSTGSGIVEVVVTGANVATTIAVEVVNDTYINPIDPTCDIQIPTLSLEFYNTSDSLNSFTEDVKANITSQIISQGSAIIVTQSAAEINHIFDTSNAWILNTVEGIDGNYPPSVPTFNPIVGGTIDLMNNPVSGLMNYVLNDVVGVNGSIGLNTIINTLTNNTGAFNFNYGNSSLLQGFPTLAQVSYNLVFGQLTLTPLWVNVSGLNTFTKSSIAVPVTNFSLDTYTLMESLELTVEFGINFTFSEPAAQGGGLYQTAAFKANLQHASLFAELYVIFSKMLLSFLTPNQLLSPGCLLNTINFAQFNDFRLNFTVRRKPPPSPPLSFSSFLLHSHAHTNK